MLCIFLLSSFGFYLDVCYSYLMDYVFDMCDYNYSDIFFFYDSNLSSDAFSYFMDLVVLRNSIAFYCK